MDMAVVNSYILYKKSMHIQNYKPISHFCYRMNIIHHLFAGSLEDNYNLNINIYFNKKK